MVTQVMNTKKLLKPIPWFSGGLATLVALLIAAVVLPNTPRAVVDKSVSPPGVRIEQQPLLVCGILAATFLPVLCIFTLGRRWILFDWLGWIVLVLLLVATILS